VFVVWDRLARLGTLAAGFRATFTDHDGMRPVPGNDLCGGGAAGRTILTVRQCRQVFFLALEQHTQTMRRTGIACPLAVRAGRSALQHPLHAFPVIHLVVLRLPQLGEPQDADEGQSHQTDTSACPDVHPTLLFRKTVSRRQRQELSSRRSDRNDEKTDVDEHSHAFIHVGLLCNEPPSMAGLPFIQSSDEFNEFSLSSGPWKAMHSTRLARGFQSPSLRKVPLFVGSPFAAEKPASSR